jgi:hypothetical protein
MRTEQPLTSLNYSERAQRRPGEVVFPQVGAIGRPWFTPMRSSKCAQRTSTASKPQVNYLDWTRSEPLSR